MNQKYYPVDFQAQYQETSQKVIEISQTYRDYILTKQPDPIEQIQLNLQSIQNQVQQKGLQFQKQSIYSQFASGQLMAERRKQPPEMCPECGQELKKQVQCQFCAQLFCKKCCSRSRIIPFVSKQIHLCCEQCHWKFVKLFDNKQFYEEKEKLVNVINFVRNKTNKVLEKVNLKRKEVEQMKKEKLNQKIKEKANESKLQQQEKKLKLLQQEFRRVIAQKAQRIQQHEQRKRLEEEQRIRQKAAETERLRQDQEEKRRRTQIQKQQQQRRAQQERRKQEKSKEQQEKTLLQAKLRKEKEELQRELNRSKQEEMRKKDQEIMQLRRELEKRNSQQKIRKNSGNSIKSKNKQKSTDSLKDLQQRPISNIKLPETELNKQKIEKPRKVSEDIDLNLQIPKLQSYKSSRDSYNSVKAESQPPKKQQAIETKNTEQQSQDTLQKNLANMFKVKKEQKKDDDSKSMLSSASKAKSIMDMSVNELLAMRVPASTKSGLQRSSSRIQSAEPKQKQKETELVPDSIEETVEKSSQVFLAIEDSIFTPKKSVDRNSIKQVIEQTQINHQQIKIHRDSILRNSSLMSSTNKEGATPQLGTDAPSKCTCLIM